MCSKVTLAEWDSAGVSAPDVWFTDTKEGWVTSVLCEATDKLFRLTGGVWPVGSADSRFKVAACTIPAEVALLLIGELTEWLLLRSDDRGSPLETIFDASTPELTERTGGTGFDGFLFDCGVTIFS
jgi:hypothetical protein